MWRSTRSLVLFSGVMGVLGVGCSGSSAGSSASSASAAASTGASTSSHSSSGASSSSHGSSAGASSTTSSGATSSATHGSTSSASSTGGASTATSASGSGTSASAASSSSSSSSSSGASGCGNAELLAGLQISLGLQLSASTAVPGQTITATATLTNSTSAAITLMAADIAGRPPGGTNSSGPFDDFLDGAGTTLAAGQSFVLHGSRAFTSADPVGSWYAYVTLQDASGTFHDSACDVTFTVATAGASSGSSGSTGSTAGSSTSSSSGGTTSSSSASSSSSSGGPPPGDAGFYNLGINVPGLTYYNNAALYTDMTLAMGANNGPWDDQTTDDAAALDSTGAPTVAAWAGVSGDYPAGTYTATWDGSGSLSVSGQSLGAVTVTNSGGVQHNSATLTWTPLLVSPGWVQWKAAPPITNIHIIASPALAASGSLYLNNFLSLLQPFTNYRFMDALNTNGTTVQNWSDRTWPSAGSRTSTNQGMAYEDIIALANTTGADIWINVPVFATDDYVCRMARLFHYGEPGDMSNAACDPSAPAGAATTPPLNSHSTLYVEYSNETWNYGFSHTTAVYCMANGVPNYGPTCPSALTGGPVTAPVSAAVQTALANTSLPWDTSNTYGRESQMVAALDKRQADIFRTVFGCSGGTGCQAQMVLNMQAANPGGSDEAFQFLKTGYGSVTDGIDVVGVAPYFNIDSDTASSGAGCYDCSVDAIFADLTSDVIDANPASSDGNAIENWMKADVTEASTYGLPLVAYEGGQGLSGSTNQTYLIAAQDDPRMYTATLQAMALWDATAGRQQLFNYYSMVGGQSQYGSWGALVNQAAPNTGSQKWDALLSLTRLPGDANLDGVVDAQDCAILTANFHATPGTDGLWWMQGDFNHDGAVDSLDLALMNDNLSGQACAP